MCGRFDTSHLYWRDIHAQLSSFLPVRTEPLNLEPNDDVRPTTEQLVAHVQDGAWTLEKMRWGLVPFWRGGKPPKDSAKGADDGFKLTTFNCKVETCHSASTFRDAFAKRRCNVPASAWYEWTGDKGAKTKHRFARADGSAIWFAGLWDRCTTPTRRGAQLHHSDRPVGRLAVGLPHPCAADADAPFKAVRPERFELRAAETPAL